MLTLLLGLLMCLLLLLQLARCHLLSVSRTTPLGNYCTADPPLC